MLNPQSQITFISFYIPVARRKFYLANTPKKLLLCGKSSRRRDSLNLTIFESRVSHSLPYFYFCFHFFLPSFTFIPHASSDNHLP